MDVSIRGVKIICEYRGVVVSAGRNTCQNCGARVYGNPTFVDRRTTKDHVYRTLYKQEREMRLKRYMGLILIVIGIVCIFISLIIPNFWLGFALIGFSLGLIIGGAITIYQNVNGFGCLSRWRYTRLRAGKN